MKLKFVVLMIIAILSKPWGREATPADRGTLDQEDLFINNLIGSWHGNGTLMGANAKFKMQWDWVLNKQFVRLTFENRMLRSDGNEVIFKAQGFYQPKDEENYEGTWFDSRGMVLPLSASIEDSGLVTLWGNPETEQGRTIYRLLGHDSIEVLDFILKGNDWKKFGSAVYKRE